jgi:hypothetical protein
MNELSAQDIKAMGYLYPRQLADGTWIALAKMMYTVGLVVGIDRVGYRKRFCYETATAAVLAVTAWNGQGDPPGMWIKEKPGDRFNPAWADLHRDEAIA